jgi:hypothetical protein
LKKAYDELIINWSAIYEIIIYKIFAGNCHYKWNRIAESYETKFIDYRLKVYNRAQGHKKRGKVGEHGEA